MEHVLQALKAMGVVLREERDGEEEGGSFRGDQRPPPDLWDFSIPASEDGGSGSSTSSRPKAGGPRSALL
jgi:hypothetical protein